MLENKSADFKTLVLLRLTKKLIENTESFGMFRLEQILKNKKDINLFPITAAPKPKTRKDFKKDIKQEVKEKLAMIPSAKIEDEWALGEPTGINKGPPRLPARRLPPRPTMAPKPRMARPQQRAMPLPQGGDNLPAHLQYLKPTGPPTKKLDIDLGKLNPFLQDPNVREIETEGEDEVVTVKGTMGKKPTSVKLSKEEIDEILDKFSKEAKIPKTEGLFKVTLGNLILTAMVSEAISSRFIIKKI